MVFIVPSILISVMKHIWCGQVCSFFGFVTLLRLSPCLCRGNWLQRWNKNIVMLCFHCSCYTNIRNVCFARLTVW